MLALSPPLFLTTYGWPLENLVIENLQQECNDISSDAEANSYSCLLDFPAYNQIRNNFVPENSISSEELVNGYTDDPMKVVKKLNHNASERDRRKRINELYGFLRSLLPMSSDQKKKVSIPGTVSRALKYIPELQKEVETLIHKKENLLLCSSSRNINGIEHVDTKDQSANEAMIQAKSTIVSSVNVLNEKEVVIQLVSSTNNMNKSKEFGFLSKVLEYLEGGDGLLLINATTFNCFGDRRLNTLHLQVEGNHKFEAEKLREQLCSL